MSLPLIFFYSKFKLQLNCVPLRILEIMIRDITKGVGIYFVSFKLMNKIKLWGYFKIPILISLAVGLLLTFLSFTLSDDIGQLLSRLWFWEWGKETFAKIGSFLGGVLILLVGFIIYKHIVLALVSPFMSPVSEKIEAYYIAKNRTNINFSERLHRKTSFQQQLIRGVRINFRNLIKELFFTIILLPFSLVPFINFIVAPLLFLIQSYYAGFGNMDYTLERYFNYKESIAFVKKNKGIALGNGIIFTLLLLIPVVGFIIVLPLSVTASSIKTIERLNTVAISE